MWEIGGSPASEAARGVIRKRCQWRADNASSVPGARFAEHRRGHPAFVAA